MMDLRDAVSAIWRYRELLIEFTNRDIRIRYKQAVMGFAWAVLMPLLIVGAGLVVRVILGRVSGSTIDSRVVAGLAVKAIPWGFFVGALQFATGSLVANANLVSKVYFPRTVLPLSSVLAQSLDSMIGAVVVVLVVPMLGAAPAWQWLWVLPLSAAIFAFTLGLALMFSCANLFFRDVKYVVQVLLTFGIFFTPVFYEPAMLGGTGGHVAMLNPLAPMLEGLRLAVVVGHNLMNPLHLSESGLTVAWSPWYLGYSMAAAIAVMTGGLIVFQKAQPVFAEYV